MKMRALFCCPTPATPRFGAAKVYLEVADGLRRLGWEATVVGPDQTGGADPAALRDYLRTHAPTAALSEVDRYISWPGQALSYKLGQIRIVELRKRAERELGAKFDVRDFHDVVLREGSLPLDLLQAQVEKYIAANR